MKTETKNYLIFFLGALFIISIFVFIKLYNENKNLKIINEQNKLSLENMKKEQDKEFTRYTKFIEIQSSLIDSMNSIMVQKDKQIIYYLKTNIELTKIISEGYGTIKDTVFLTKDCIGLEMNFQDSTDLYFYKLLVRVDRKPFHRLEFKINPIQDLYAYIGIDKDDHWYTNITLPAKYRDFINISSIETKLDQSVFEKFNNSIFQNRFSFMLSGGFEIQNNVWFRIGGGLKYENYLFEYQKGIGNNFHYINIGKFFNLF